MAEVLRQLSCSYKRIVAVVEHDHLPAIEDAWKYLPKDVRSLQSLIKVAQSYHGDRAPVAGESGLDRALKQDTWLEFVEKLAIFDVLFEPFIHENFVQLNSFPFSHKGFLGHETAVLNVFTFWNHYRSKYSQELSKVTAAGEQFAEYQKEMGFKFEGDGDSSDQEEQLAAELGMDADEYAKFKESQESGYDWDGRR